MTYPTSDLNGQAGLLQDDDVVWRTRDGQYIAVKEMSDKHLLNTIRMLREMSPIGTKFKTTAVSRRQWINVLANEAYSRGLSLDDLTESEPVHE